MGLRGDFKTAWIWEGGKEAFTHLRKMTFCPNLGTVAQ